MDLKNRVAVVTGAAGGVGAAVAWQLSRAGARAVVVSDVDMDAAVAVAEGIDDEGGHAVARRADVTSRADVRGLVAFARGEYGGLDLFCSNGADAGAGISYGTGIHAVDSQWARSWQVNVMQHVYAAQAALPGMLRAGSGYLLLTASGGGRPGDAPCWVAKHAAVGLAEWLAAAYRTRGIRVSALCVGPGPLEPEPEEIAEATIAGIAAERLFILPHELPPEQAAQLRQRNAADPDAWVEHTITEAAAALRGRN